MVIDLSDFDRGEVRLLLSLFRSAGTQEFLIEILTIEGRRAGLSIAAVVAKNVRQDIFINPVLLFVLHITVEIVACLRLFIGTHEIILLLYLKIYTANGFFGQALVVRICELPKIIHSPILIFGGWDLEVIHGEDVFLAYLADLNTVEV